MSAAIALIKDHLYDHRIGYALIGFVALCSLSAGVVTASTLFELGEQGTALIYSSGGGALLSAFWLSMRFFLLTALCSFFIVGVAPAAVLAGVRGYLTGFSIGLIGTQVHGFPTLVIGVCMTPAIALTVFTQIAASVIAADAALFCVKAGIKLPVMEKINYIKPSLLAICGLFLFSLAGAAYELAVVPGLLARLTAP